jgi:hypothetical protein
MTIGDAGLPNDDASYTGVVDSSAVSVQYWRDKATEFQNVLNAVDQTARAATEFAAATSDQQTIDYLVGALNEFELKKTALRLAAEGVNAGAATINAAGGRFPSLSIPQGLGVAPLVIGAAAVAAFGAAAALISWGNSWIAGVNERMRYAALLDAGDPEIGRILARAEAAQQAANASPVSQLSGVLKWGAFAVLALMAWPHIQKLLPK